MISQLAPEPAARRLYWTAGALAAITLPALLVDLPVARSTFNELLPGDARRILDWSELVAHGYGVALIGLTVYVLDVPRRRQIPRMMASAYVAGLLANLVKLLIARVRPRFFGDGGVRDTFLGFLPLLLGTDSSYAPGFPIQSFPSGHTATAVGLALGLTQLYPRGRWLFLSYALLAALQRIDVRAHYVSDTVAAAALGFLGAALVTHPRVLGRWFDRFEKAAVVGVGSATEEPVH